jgi:hypothetical protein
MTTQAEPQHPPAQTYPTSPPWATPPAAAPVEAPPPAPMVPVYGGVAPYGSPLPPHGQLLVPYPDEMRNASRPTPPSWWPIVPLTFLLVAPGLISTVRRSAQARRGRNSEAPYWVTFAASLPVLFLVWGVILAVAIPVAWNARETAITKSVQKNIVSDGQLTSKSRLTATSAVCEPNGSRSRDGQRPYSCLLKLDDGRTGTIDVSADSDGNWTAVPLAKTTKPVKK